MVRDFVLNNTSVTFKVVGSCLKQSIMNYGLHNSTCRLSSKATGGHVVYSFNKNVWHVVKTKTINDASSSGSAKVSKLI